MEPVLTETDLVQILRERGIHAPLPNVRSFLASVDREALKNELRARYRIEVWDRKSPINGVPAESILATRRDIPPGGLAYLIVRDGRVLYFQPHDPFEPGLVKLTEANVQEVAGRHVEAIVEQEADQAIIQRGLEQLGGLRP